MQARGEGWLGKPVGWGAVQACRAGWENGGAVQARGVGAAAGTASVYCSITISVSGFQLEVLKEKGAHAVWDREQSKLIRGWQALGNSLGVGSSVDALRIDFCGIPLARFSDF